MKHRFASFTFLLLASFAAITLSGCGILETLLSELSAAENATNVVSRTDEGEGWYSETPPLPVSLASVGESAMTGFLPSTGNVNILVLPIEFTDVAFGENILRDLNTVLNGTASETGYWESVKSFYERASFGKVHLSFEIAPIYKSTYTQQGLYNQYVHQSGSGYKSDNAANIVHDAYLSYQSTKTSTDPDYMKDHFDSDHNGWVDGIVAVYSGQNYQKGNLSYDKATYYWAYTYWLIGENQTWSRPNKDAPTPNLYFWLSYDFIYEAVKSPRVDAHTLIHETGHMFGLDDYYPDTSGNDGFNAAGCWSMMDQNILDLDIYSKLVLGWINPIIASGTGKVSLNSSASSGDCIIFPTTSWNETVYDEYMLLEFYTPTDLNYLDSHSIYPGRLLGYTIPGIKLYHVDSRLVSYSKQGFNPTYEYVTNPNLIGPINYNSLTGYGIAATNCHKNPQKANVNFSLLHLMEATGINTFKNGGMGTNDTLFKAGQSFSFDRFGEKFFPNKTTMNNGASFPFEIKIDMVSNNQADISFTKAA